MISIKSQKKLMFIPIINVSIMFIMIFINSKFMKKGWKLKAIISLYISMLITIPLLFIKDWLATVINQKTVVDLLLYYIFSLIIVIPLIILQNKMIDVPSK